MNLNARVLLTNENDISNSIFEQIVPRSAWLHLPFTPEELRDTLVSIGVDDFDPDDIDEATDAVKKVCVSEFKSDWLSDEIDYQDLFAASDLVERIEDLNDYESGLMDALIEDGATLDEAVSEAEDPGDVEWYPLMDFQDLAIRFVEEEMFSTEYLLQHIDYDSIGRDLSFDGYKYVNGGILRRN